MYEGSDDGHDDRHHRGDDEPPVQPGHWGRRSEDPVGAGWYLALVGNLGSLENDSFANGNTGEGDDLGVFEEEKFLIAALCV